MRSCDAVFLNKTKEPNAHCSKKTINKIYFCKKLDPNK